MSTQKFNLGQWIKTAVQNVEKFLGLLKDEAVTILTWGDNFVNHVVTLAASPEGQLIEAALSSVLPVGFETKFLAFLPTLLTDMNFAKAEANKTDDEIFQDFLKYVASLKGNVKAAQLNSLNALVSTWLSEQKEKPLPIQQVLTATQVIHNPAVSEVVPTN